MRKRGYGWVNEHREWGGTFRNKAKQVRFDKAVVTMKDRVKNLLKRKRQEIFQSQVDDFLSNPMDKVRRTQLLFQPYMGDSGSKAAKIGRVIGRGLKYFSGFL